LIKPDVDSRITIGSIDCLLSTVPTPADSTFQKNRPIKVDKCNSVLLLLTLTWHSVHWQKLSETTLLILSKISKSSNCGLQFIHGHAMYELKSAIRTFKNFR